MYLQSLMKFHHCLFKILRKNQNVVGKELQRAITLTELASNPYFSIINVHLVDIKSYEMLSLPFQDTEKPKRRGRTNGRTDNVKTVYPPQTQFAGCIMKKCICMRKIIRTGQHKMLLCRNQS